MYVDGSEIPMFCACRTFDLSFAKQNHHKYVCIDTGWRINNRRSSSSELSFCYFVSFVDLIACVYCVLCVRSVSVGRVGGLLCGCAGGVARRVDRFDVTVPDITCVETLRGLLALLQDAEKNLPMLFKVIARRALGGHRFATAAGAKQLCPVSCFSTSGSSGLQPSQVQLKTSDAKLGNPDFTIHFLDAKSGDTISPWHDISLFSEREGCFNMLNEIPRYTTPKMEVATKMEFNPIVQDEKKGKLRNYHGPLYWNYGCLTQTWEDPTVEHPAVENCNGDNDPLDVVEIGSDTIPMGAIVPVKPLGILSMIDDGELDWKLIAIRVDDPAADKLHDIADVEKHFPGTVSGIREWFRWYKTPDGKPINAFGHGERALGKDVALEVIHETHAFWQALTRGETSVDKIWIP